MVNIFSRRTLSALVAALGLCTTFQATAGSSSVPIYIAGKQFNNKRMPSTADDPFSSLNSEEMNYDLATDCYYYTFTASSDDLDNAFSLSTQVGTYSQWDVDGSINEDLHRYYSVTIPVDEELDKNGTDGLAAHGGQPISADDNPETWTYGILDPITDFTRWHSDVTYNNSIHNWSLLAAQDNYIAVAIEPLFIADRRMDDEEYRNLPAMTATCAVTYPVVQSSELTLVQDAAHSAAPAISTLAGGSSTKALIPLKFTSEVPIIFGGGNITTGCDIIAIDNAEPAYYNLQGIRVERPEPGNVYIVVSADGSVTKQLIR